MESKIQNSSKNLSEDDKKLLIGVITSFLFNHPIEETKNRLWTFYMTWVCNGAKVAEPDEHEDNILFYVNIIEFFKSCSSILKMDDN